MRALHGVVANVLLCTLHCEEAGVPLPAPGELTLIVAGLLGLCRLIPGLRVYTSLVAGAVGVDRRRFVLGMALAAVLWVIHCIVVGVVAGVPAKRFLGEVQGLILQGGILVVAGVGGYVAHAAHTDGGRGAQAAGLRAWVRRTRQVGVRAG